MLSAQPEARRMVAAGAQLLDVRSPSEFATGHLPGARNIPVQELGERLRELSPGALVVVYCRSGARSATAKALLEGAGFRVLDIGAMGNW